MREPLAQAAIALGSNLGERERMLARAMVALERSEGLVVLRRSRWIETAPVGGPPGQGPYLNGAALLETRMGPRALLELLLSTERHLGRLRAERDAPRTIDLDLLDYGGLFVDEPGLCLPHPRMEERLFVLEPLDEIAPGWILPRSGKTVHERLLELRLAPSVGDRA